MEVLYVLYQQRETTEDDNDSTAHQQAALFCLSDLVQVLSLCQCLHKHAQSRTGYRMMMPAVPEFRLHGHTHKHTHTHREDGGGRRLRGICSNGWHIDHNIKKALGLRSGFMGRLCVSDDARDWMPGPAWDLPCFQSNQTVRLSDCKLPRRWKYHKSIELYLRRDDNGEWHGEE